MRKIKSVVSLPSSATVASSTIIGVELLDDAGGILDNLWVTVRDLLSKRVYDGADAHLFKLLPTLLVHAKVADGEKGDSSW